MRLLYADSSRFGTCVSRAATEQPAALTKGVPSDLHDGAVLRIGHHINLQCAPAQHPHGLCGAGWDQHCTTEAGT